MEPPITDPADELLRTYTESGGINYLDAAAMLPSRPAIELACFDLMSLMFPGFHGEAAGCAKCSGPTSTQPTKAIPPPPVTKK
jgi:hypothetical protein